MAIGISGVPQIMQYPYENPLIQGLMQGNQLSHGFLANIQQALENKKAQAQLPFAGPQAEAELKYTQAQTPHIEAQTKKIMEEIPWIGKEKASEIALRQAQRGHLGAQTNQLNYQLSHPETMYSMENFLLKKLMEQGNNPQSQNNIPIQETPSIQGQSLSSQGIKPTITPPNLNVKMTGDPILDTLLQNKVGLNPQQKAEMKAYENKLIIDNNEYKKIQESESKINSTILGAREDLSDFLNAYNQLGSFQRGVVGGKIPAISSHAQEADRAATDLITKLAPLWQKGHITNTDVILQGKAKVGREFNPLAAQKISRNISASMERLNERGQFFNTLQKNGVDAGTAEAMWNNYNDVRPIINRQTRLPNKIFNNSWKDFINQDAVNAAIQGVPYVPQNQNDLINKNPITKDSIAFTAKKYHKSEDQVILDLMNNGVI